MELVSDANEPGSDRGVIQVQRDEEGQQER